MSWYATKKASKLPSMNKSKILVFDTETTGLSAQLDEILQITILDGYGSVLFSSYIKPRIHKAWPAAQAVNKISYSMVKTAPHFSEVKDEIQSLFNNAKLIVGYNVNFDINFVEAAGIIVSGSVFDVMTAFASYRAAVEETHFTRKCKLKECAEYFGFHYSPHDSEEDARVTLNCFDRLISDSRFTTYKKREKAELKKKVQENGTGSRRKTHFTIQFRFRRRHPIFFGLLITAIGYIWHYFLSNSWITSIEVYAQKLFLAYSHFSEQKLTAIALTVIGIGVLATILGILRFIFRLIRLIIMKFKHLLSL